MGMSREAWMKIWESKLERGRIEKLLSAHMGYSANKLKGMSDDEVMVEVDKCWRYSPHTYEVAKYHGDWLPSMGGRQYFRNKLVDGMSSTE